MKIIEEVRIDKFLWAVRIFKTRGDASDACKNGKVKINGVKIKPSKILLGKESIEIKKSGIWHKYLVLNLIDKRIGAKLVAGIIKETTSIENLQKIELAKQVKPYIRARGLGRPTKKERRDIDNWQTNE